MTSVSFQTQASGGCGWRVLSLIYMFTGESCLVPLMGDWGGDIASSLAAEHRGGGVSLHQSQTKCALLNSLLPGSDLGGTCQVPTPHSLLGTCQSQASGSPHHLRT